MLSIGKELKYRSALLGNMGMATCEVCEGQGSKLVERTVSTFFGLFTRKMKVREECRNCRGDGWYIDDHSQIPPERRWKGPMPFV